MSLRGKSYKIFLSLSGVLCRYKVYLGVATGKALNSWWLFYIFIKTFKISCSFFSEGILPFLDMALDFASEQYLNLSISKEFKICISKRYVPHAFGLQQSWAIAFLSFSSTNLSRVPYLPATLYINILRITSGPVVLLDSGNKWSSFPLCNFLFAILKICICNFPTKWSISVKWVQP